MKGHFSEKEWPMRTIILRTILKGHFSARKHILGDIFSRTILLKDFEKDIIKRTFLPVTGTSFHDFWVIRKWPGLGSEKKDFIFIRFSMAESLRRNPIRIEKMWKRKSFALEILPLKDPWAQRRLMLKIWFTTSFVALRKANLTVVLKWVLQVTDATRACSPESGHASESRKWVWELVLCRIL